MQGLLDAPLANATAMLDVLQPVDLTAPLNRGLLNWHLVLPLPQGGVLWQNLVRPSAMALTATEPRSATLGWAPTSRPGGFGEVRLNGSAYGRLASSTVYDFANTTFTLSCWARITLGAQQHELLARRQSAAAVGGWYLRVDTAGTVTARLSGASTNTAQRVSVSTPFTGIGWHHLLAVYTTSTTVLATNDITLYIDGVLDQGAKTGTVVYAVDPIDVILGSSVSLQVPFAVGAMDDVRIYTRGLSATEALQLYQASRTGYRRELRWLSSSFFVAPAGTSRSLVAALQGVSATPAPGRAVRRRLTGTSACSSVTPTLVRTARRRLASTLAASSTTPAAARGARHALHGTVQAASATAPAAGRGTRRLHSSLLGTTTTPALAAQLPGQHVLSAHPAAVTQTPPAAAGRRRRLTSTLLVVSSTPTLPGATSVAHPLTAILAAVTQTPSLGRSVRRPLHGAAQGSSLTPAAIALGAQPPPVTPLPPILGGMHPALAAMLTQQVAHEAYLGQDGYGAPVFAPPVVRAARLEWKLRSVRTLSGEERLSQSRVFLNGVFRLDVRDQLTLPDATRPQILRVSSVVGLDGALDHYEVYV